MADTELSAFQNLSLMHSAPGRPPVESVSSFRTCRADSESSNALHIPKHFLEFPLEVLQLICMYTFTCFEPDPDGYDAQTDTWASRLLVASPKYDLGDRNKNLEQDYRMPWYESLSVHCSHLGLPKNTLALLSTCTKLYETGAPVFYGLYTFWTTSAESFRLLFTKHIGPSNLRSIRKLIIGLPHGVRAMPSKYIGRYTRMLDFQMPQLQEFTITTRYGRYFTPVTQNPGSAWIEGHRGMLWFAAWINRSHPFLKCAVWNEQCAVVTNVIETEGLDAGPDLKLSITIFSVKPHDVQVVEGPREVQAWNAELQELYGEPHADGLGHLVYDGIDPATGLPYEALTVLPATRILLDSWKIRRTGFVGLSTFETCRPYAYQLPKTANNSEANRPSDADMEGQVFVEEMLLHNKNPQTTLAKLEAAKYNTHLLCLRAKALENKNIEEEMLMKRGPPIPDRSENGAGADGADGDGDDDDNNDAGWGHGNGDWEGDNLDETWGDNNDGEDGDDLNAHHSHGHGWSV